MGPAQRYPISVALRAQITSSMCPKTLVRVVGLCGPGARVSKPAQYAPKLLREQWAYVGSQKSGQIPLISPKPLAQVCSGPMWASHKGTNDLNMPYWGGLAFETAAFQIVGRHILQEWEVLQGLVPDAVTLEEP